MLADDVVIVHVSDTELPGRIRLQFYVKRMGGVIPPQAVVTAVEVTYNRHEIDPVHIFWISLQANRQAFADRNITVDSIMVAVPPSSTPAVSTTVTPPVMSPPVLSDGVIVGIVFGIVIPIVLFAVIIVVAILCHK